MTAKNMASATQDSPNPNNAVTAALRFALAGTTARGVTGVRAPGRVCVVPKALKRRAAETAESG